MSRTMRSPNGIAAQFEAKIASSPPSSSPHSQGVSTLSNMLAAKGGANGSASKPPVPKGFKADLSEISKARQSISASKPSRSQSEDTGRKLTRSSSSGSGTASGYKFGEGKSLRKVRPESSKPSISGNPSQSKKPALTSKPQIDLTKRKSISRSNSKSNTRSGSRSSSQGSSRPSSPTSNTLSSTSQPTSPKPDGRQVLCIVDGVEKKFVLPHKFFESPKLAELSPLLMGMLQNFTAVLNYKDSDGHLVAIRDQEDLELYMSERIGSDYSVCLYISNDGDYSVYNTGK